jgi:hypothetical protein
MPEIAQLGFRVVAQRTRHVVEHLRLNCGDLMRVGVSPLLRYFKVRYCAATSFELRDEFSELVAVKREDHVRLGNLVHPAQHQALGESSNKLSLLLGDEFLQQFGMRRSERVTGLTPTVNH